MSVQGRAASAKKARRQQHQSEELVAPRGRTRLLYLIATLLSLIGLADALYLTIKHLTGESARCTISGGCGEVLGSAYSTVGGIPVAAIGALAYFTVFSLATLLLYGYRRARPLLTVIVGLMLVTTLWLLAVQAFILHKYCDYCLLSAGITLALSGIIVALRFTNAKE
jgi:uncharacterized membrane protein